MLRWYERMRIGVGVNDQGLRNVHELPAARSVLRVGKVIEQASVLSNRSAERVIGGLDVGLDVDDEEHDFASSVGIVAHTLQVGRYAVAVHSTDIGFKTAWITRKVGIDIIRALGNHDDNEPPEGVGLELGAEGTGLVQDTGIVSRQVAKRDSGCNPVAFGRGLSERTVRIGRSKAPATSCSADVRAPRRACVASPGGRGYVEVPNLEHPDDAACYRGVLGSVVDLEWINDAVRTWVYWFP